MCAALPARGSPPVWAWNCGGTGSACVSRPGPRGTPAAGLADFPREEERQPPSPQRGLNGGSKPQSGALAWEKGGRSPPRPVRDLPSHPLPPLQLRGAPIGPTGCSHRAHWPAAVSSTRPPWRAHSRRAAGWLAGWRAAGGRRGQRAGGMAGAGLWAAARRWLLCGGPSGRRAASSSPSCPGCGPPGPGAHCPSTPRSASAPAPADGADLSAHLWARYQDMRRLVHDLLPPEVCSLLNPAAIYANNEISLSAVEVYGFDYDYTLAQYADSLHPEIFSAARDILIEHYKYPEGIRKYDYDPSFAIRGLHYDIQKSLLMKIDAFHYVQLGTAYRGLQPVPDEEVIDLYGGTQHIPLYQMSGFYGKGPSIKQFMDIFSLPEMALLSCVVDYFLGHSLEFDQAHLYKDVTDAIRDVHVKGLMYQWIEQDMEKYILRGDETFAVLSRLVAHGKQLFLITNSPFSFVDKGMRHMVGPDWRELFDVVIVQADKPSFFTDRRKPFRKLDEKGSLHWDRITRLEKGKIYRQGNLFDFLRLTEWRGPRVLYFGDHLYSDLADLMLRHGWRTGAIIPELEREIRIINTEQYMHSLTWQQALTGLLERMQTYQDAESRQVLAAWLKEREELRCITKALFNAQFGSIFRTFHNPTYFSRRLVRFSDLYMASLSCLLNYRVDFTFYPRRTPLQHEAPLWMDQLCTGCMKTPFLGDMAHIR